MIPITRTLLVLAAAGVTAVPVAMRTSGNRVSPTAAEIDPQQAYTKNQAEYYLTKEQLNYIRPGLHITVEDVQIPADRHPVVELSYTDDFGQPLDRAGNMTPGPVSFSYILSWYDAEDRNYVSYTTRPQTSPITGLTAIQGSTDSGGTTEDLGLGRLRYTFGTELPEDYPMWVTTTLGIYASRNLSDTPLATTQYDNVEYDFVPDGSEVVDQWEEILNSTCNSCHNQLALHGGSRRDVKLCVLCHNAETWDPDTGNSVNMKVMIHKIHFGPNLPSVQAGTPYQIIGFRQSVNDYSDTLYPQDMRNCARCHTPATPQGDVWYTEPSRAACGSCHDDIVWDVPINHPVAQYDDSLCAACHIPVGENEFDISIMGAHTIPTQSKQLPGLNMEITDVTGAMPGGTPTVYFTLTDNDGSTISPISGFQTLTLRAAGPIGDTVDNSIDISQDAREATLVGDEYMMTFGTPIPEEATGSWGFSADVRQQVLIDDGTLEGMVVTQAAFNPIYYATVTDAEPVARRVVVSIDKCNVCHDMLALHGGQRLNTLECVFCHRPNNTDEEVRPEDEMPPEGIDFRWLIHRLHTGEDLTVDFTVYGFRSSVNNYNDVVFPGDLRACETCHIDGSYNVPTPEGSQAVLTERSYYSPTQPAGAACLACHSTVDAAAHAYVNTAYFGESCASCHGVDRDFSVDSVHAQ
jgi:OmcA/MtrC family decaheme c-type cytochrome